jgi:hypothetical protein
LSTPSDLILLAHEYRLGRHLPTSYLNNTSLLGKPKPRAATARLEDDVLALKEDVTENAEADALVGLDATEASAVTDRSVVDELTRDGLLDAADGDGEVRQSSGAGEDVTTLGRRVGRSGNLSVIGADNGRVGVDESSTSVDNTGD